MDWTPQNSLCSCIIIIKIFVAVLEPVVVMVVQHLNVYSEYNGRHNKHLPAFDTLLYYNVKGDQTLFWIFNILGVFFKLRLFNYFTFHFPSIRNRKPTFGFLWFIVKLYRWIQGLLLRKVLLGIPLVLLLQRKLLTWSHICLQSGKLHSLDFEILPKF